MVEHHAAFNARIFLRHLNGCTRAEAMASDNKFREVEDDASREVQCCREVCLRVFVDLIDEADQILDFVKQLTVPSLVTPVCYVIKDDGFAVLTLSVRARPVHRVDDENDVAVAGELHRLDRVILGLGLHSVRENDWHKACALEVEGRVLGNR